MPSSELQLAQTLIPPDLAPKVLLTDEIEIGAYVGMTYASLQLTKARKRSCARDKINAELGSRPDSSG